MSGQHRKQRPARRRALLVLAFPGRVVFEKGVAAWRLLTFRVADAFVDALEWLADRWEDRYGADDPFAEVTLAPPRDTGPDPIPALAAPVEELPQETAQEPLTPEEALHVLHEQHPDLPGTHVNWRLYSGAVSGEVRALDVDEDGQREIVAEYATVFGSEVDERPDGVHLSVFAAGDFAGVRFVVAAILIDDDTMPLPAYREAAGTLETQEISEEVLTAVGAR